ncbi:hypothetical protein MJO28_014041 [Puccinia striiformis f. sp. tritici]|uniref:Uncharacterized protein n=1 Tax=Puccinia striiformis f. sp. tritici TaxID=168172 RepID=A0ACC0DWF6_9BASI|nr:hypothetical protein MJO28_014041 [Puccinia striiformis f. sp. tritici]
MVFPLHEGQSKQFVILTDLNLSKLKAQNTRELLSILLVVIFLAFHTCIIYFDDSPRTSSAVGLKIDLSLSSVQEIVLQWKASTVLSEEVYSRFKSLNAFRIITKILSLDDAIHIYDTQSRHLLFLIELEYIPILQRS